MIVLNDTRDFYRYVDCTFLAEALFSFVEETIEKELPAEIQFEVWMIAHEITDRSSPGEPVSTDKLPTSPPKPLKLQSYNATATAKAR